MKADETQGVRKEKIENRNTRYHAGRDKYLRGQLENVPIRVLITQGVMQVALV